MTVQLGVWVAAGISVTGIRNKDGLRVGPVGSWVRQSVAELSKVGLQGVEAGGEDGRQWGSDGVGGCGSGGGGGRRGKGLGVRVGLVVGKMRIACLTWMLHSQEPRNPLQQNQVDLTGRRRS